MPLTRLANSPQVGEDLLFRFSRWHSGSVEVNEERLRQLLSQGGESQGLEHKSECDLATARDRTKLASELAAMQMNPDGGYVVLGAEDDGTPSGKITEAQARMFDEATVRDKVSAYLEGSFELLVGTHEIDGDRLGLVWTGPSSDCFTIFRRDGDYTTSTGEQKKRFRAGEVFARHGTKSERWSQEDIAKIKQRLLDQRREEWAAQIQRDLPNLLDLQAAQDLARSPAKALSWQLDAEKFIDAVIEQQRQGDQIPVRLLLDQMPRDAEALLREKDDSATATLGLLLDRVVCLAAAALRIEDRGLFDRVLETLFAIYELGFDNRGIARSDFPLVQPQLFWRTIVERVMALGAFAVRRAAWPEVRQLVLQRKASGYDWSDYNNWIRHGVTMAARANLFRDESSRGAVELSLLTLAQQRVERLDCLRTDVAADSERVMDSLCQFDFLAGLIAIDEAGTPDSTNFYTSFARWFSQRTVPIISRLLTDAEMRSAIFVGDDEALALALDELNRRASGEAFAFAGWDGYRDDQIEEFIAEN